MQGEVLAIYLFPERGSAPQEVSEAEAVAGVGLRGDQPRAERRALSLIAQESWEAALAEIGEPVTGLQAGTRRANLLVRGIDLSATIGRRLRIGATQVAIHAETKPCQLMDQQRAGLRSALEPEMRGGVNGSIEVGGTIRVGDAVVAIE
jgi:MOSC domain-containing protein YiiM